MLQRWFNTYAEDACRMEDITDKDILEMSHGEVTKYGNDGKGSDTDEEIFGMIGGSDYMGHINLPCPVVNINFLYGKKPILPRMLGMSRSDIEKVAYFARYIVVKSEDRNYTAGQLLSEKEYLGAKKEKANANIMIGAQAIESLLSEKGYTAENCGAIHHILPVIPLELRYVKGSSDIWRPTSLNWSYRRVMDRAGRIRRLEKLEAPEIIMRNEKRMLQEFVDSLILNRLRSPSDFLDDGWPRDSLCGVYELITNTKEYKWKDVENLLSNSFSKDDLLTASRRIYDDSEIVAEKNAYLSAVSNCGPEYTIINDKSGNVVFQTDEKWTDKQLEELQIKYEKESKEAEKELSESAASMLHAILDRYFPDYADYYDVFLRYADQALCTAACNYSMAMTYTPDGQRVFTFRDVYNRENEMENLRWLLAGAARSMLIVRDRILPFLDKKEKQSGDALSSAK